MHDKINNYVKLVYLCTHPPLRMTLAATIDLITSPLFHFPLKRTTGHCPLSQILKQTLLSMYVQLEYAAFEQKLCKYKKKLLQMTYFQYVC